MVSSAFSTITGAPKHQETLPTGRHWAFPLCNLGKQGAPTTARSPLYSAVFAATSSVVSVLPSQLPFPSVHTKLFAASSPDHENPTSLLQEHITVRHLTLTQLRLLWYTDTGIKEMMKSKFNETVWDLRERHLIKKEKMFLFYIFEDVKVRYIPHPTNSWQNLLLMQA